MKTWIEPSKLIELLGRVPEGYKVMGNAVGNLAISDADNEYVGYIDLHDEIVEVFG